MKTAKGWRKVGSEKPARTAAVTQPGKKRGLSAEQKNKERVRKIEESYARRIDEARERVERALQSFLKQQSTRKASGMKPLSSRFKYSPYKAAVKYVEKLQKEEQREMKGAGMLPKLLNKFGMSASTSTSTAVRGYRHYTKGFNVTVRQDEVVIEFTYAKEGEVAKVQSALKQAGYTTEERFGELVVLSYNPFAIEETK